MKWLLSILVLFVLYDSITCPPVDKKKEKEKDSSEDKEGDDDDLGLEYERYLKEVVNILEQDDTFRKKLEESNTSDIRSGEIAQHLDFVQHSVRTKLDELKRREVDRLKLLSKIKHGRTNGMKILDPEVAKHVDHTNHDTFEVKDLENLIQQATQDLEDIDKKRRKEFKEYELEKEVEHRDKMRHMDEKAKIEEERKWKEMKIKHKEHPKLHHPGSRDQLEEVWEEKDHMDKESFNPKTFFFKHDINRDGELDPEEIEALFEAELAKAYDEDAEEDDLVEREEERNRMREHVFSEVDKDQDGLISLKEFLESTNQKEFNEDQGWKTLDEDPVYTDDELEEFEKEYLEEQAKEQKQWQDQQPGVVQHPVNPSHIPPIQDHMAQGQGQDQVNQMNQGQFQQPPQGGQQFQQPPQQAQHHDFQQQQAHHQQDPVAQGQPGQPIQQQQQQNQQQQEHPSAQQMQDSLQQHQQDPNIQQQHPNVQHIQENQPQHQQDPNIQHHQQDPNIQQQQPNIQQQDPNVQQQNLNAVPQGQHQEQPLHQ